MKYLILLIILFSSCSKEPKLQDNYYYQGMLFEHKIGHIIAKELDIIFSSYGLNDYETDIVPQKGKIYNLDLSFTSLKKADRNEARKLLLKCIKEVLLLVNSDKIIKSYLANYPFTYKNLSITLSFYDRAHRRRKDGSICNCFLSRNIITYSTAKEIGYNKRHKETYEEALKIVQSQENKGR